MKEQEKVDKRAVVEAFLEREGVLELSSAKIAEMIKEEAGIDISGPTIWTYQRKKKTGVKPVPKPKSPAKPAVTAPSAFAAPAQAKPAAAETAPPPAINADSIVGIMKAARELVERCGDKQTAAKILSAI